jgi:hypothetical protein
MSLGAVCLICSAETTVTGVGALYPALAMREAVTTRSAPCVVGAIWPLARGGAGGAPLLSPVPCAMAGVAARHRATIAMDTEVWKRPDFNICTPSILSIILVFGWSVQQTQGTGRHSAAKRSMRERALENRFV